VLYTVLQYFLNELLIHKFLSIPSLQSMQSISSYKTMALTACNKDFTSLVIFSTEKKTNK